MAVFFVTSFENIGLGQRWQNDISTILSILVWVVNFKSFCTLKGKMLVSMTHFCYLFV